MGAIAFVQVGVVSAACAAGGLLSVPSVAAADSPMCLGRAVTITARPGEVVSDTTGPDVILGTRGQDEVRARDGSDLICGGRGRDVLYGGKGRDLLSGGAAEDLLYGGKGWDGVHLVGDGDEEHAGGEPLNDDAYYWDSGAAVTVDLELGTGHVTGRRTTHRLTDVDRVVGTHFADIIRGSEGRDGLAGERGDDVIEGREAKTFWSATAATTSSTEARGMTGSRALRAPGDTTCSTAAAALTGARSARN